MTAHLIGWSWLTASFEHVAWTIVALVIALCVYEIAWFANKCVNEALAAEDEGYRVLRGDHMGDLSTLDDARLARERRGL